MMGVGEHRRRTATHRQRGVTLQAASQAIPARRTASSRSSREWAAFHSSSAATSTIHHELPQANSKPDSGEGKNQTDHIQPWSTRSNDCSSSSFRGENLINLQQNAPRQTQSEQQSSYSLDKLFDFSSVPSPDPTPPAGEHPSRRRCHQRALPNPIRQQPFPFRQPADFMFVMAPSISSHGLPIAGAPPKIQQPIRSQIQKPSKAGLCHLHEKSTAMNETQIQAELGRLVGSKLQI
ncbi:hypothetical protein ACLOJK_006614 [Asimina triloba]